MKTHFRSRLIRHSLRIVFVVALILLTQVRSPAGEPSSALLTVSAHQTSQRLPETGLASYYGEKYHGKPTASGERFNLNEMTAAHPNLAFGTRVKVTHLESKRSVIVSINDRGPFVPGRVIDLSKAAAAELGMIQSGLAQVRIEILP